MAIEHKEFHIVKEYTPSRCEICHQSDLFDSISLHCSRCIGLVDTQKDLSYFAYRRELSRESIQRSQHFDLVNEHRMCHHNAKLQYMYSQCEAWVCHIFESIFTLPLLMTFGISFAWGCNISIDAIVTASLVFTLLTGVSLIFLVVSMAWGDVLILKLSVYGIIIFISWYLALVMGYLMVLS